MPPGSPVGWTCFSVESLATNDSTPCTGDPTTVELVAWFSYMGQIG
jgi:hypothetical protein